MGKKDDEASSGRIGNKPWRITCRGKRGVGAGEDEEGGRLHRPPGVEEHERGKRGTHTHTHTHTLTHRAQHRGKEEEGREGRTSSEMFGSSASVSQ